MVTFDPTGITFLHGAPPLAVEHLDYSDVIAIQVTGPGTISSGGGFIGGGFGVEGAITGIAIGALLNKLTTRTQVFTFIQIETVKGEIFLHYPGAEPGALRIELSPVFVQVRHSGSKSD